MTGRHEREREHAARLLARGLSESEVAELTDLPLEEVAGIAQKTPARSDRFHSRTPMAWTDPRTGALVQRILLRDGATELDVLLASGNARPVPFASC